VISVCSSLFALLPPFPRLPCWIYITADIRVAGLVRFVRSFKLRPVQGPKTWDTIAEVRVGEEFKVYSPSLGTCCLAYFTQDLIL
jgi:hypothetical protein